MVEEFSLAQEVFQSDAVEVFLRNEPTLVEIIHLVEQGGKFPFELPQFFVSEEVRGVGENLQFVVEQLGFLCTLLGFLLQAIVLPENEEGNHGNDDNEDNDNSNHIRYTFLVAKICNYFDIQKNDIKKTISGAGVSLVGFPLCGVIGRM